MTAFLRSLGDCGEKKNGLSLVGRGFLKAFSFVFFCFGPQPAPQLELVCWALLSHSHLMENICCHAFYSEVSAVMSVWGGGVGLVGVGRLRGELVG